MSRVQLALNVADLDAAVDFYTRLFGTPPHKQRDGYANFAIADPPLKLVLFASDQTTGTSLNHLGVEVESTDEVTQTGSRLKEAGLPTRDSVAELCCHAVQDKVYAADPNGGEWEIYTILDDAPEEPLVTLGAPVASDAAACCGTGGC